MLKPLRKRLTLLFTLFAGLLFTAALAVVFVQMLWRAQGEQEARFSGTAQQVATKIINNAGGFPQAGLEVGSCMVFAKQNGEDMGVFLAKMHGSGQTALAGTAEDERLALFAQAKARAEDEGLSQLTQNYYVYTAPALGTGQASTADGDAQESVGAGAVQRSAYVAPGRITIAPALQEGEGFFEIEREGERYAATYFNWEAEAIQTGGLVFYEVAVLENLSEQTRQFWMNALWYLLVWLAGLGLLAAGSWFLAKGVLRTTEEGLRRQREFVAAASHELRSPLAVIRASLSAAQAEGPAAPDKFYAAAVDETTRMGRLVDDLLLLAGDDAGSWQLHALPVDLDTLLIDAAEAYAPLAKGKGLQLRLALPEETLPRVQGDAERLRQVLAVLLDNALQYAPESTAVTLQAKARRGRVEITVEDRGCGIPDEEKSRVFERFYRVDKSRHDKAHFGLGLSVAQQLAVLHKGQLAVADTEGGGATFKLTLPAL